jgi:hypothetical protein
MIIMPAASEPREAASEKAAPRVGPAQGAQASASTPPAAAWPASPPSGSRSPNRWAAAPRPTRLASNLSDAFGKTRTSPIAIMIAAEAARSPVRAPISIPSAAAAPPAIANVRASPAARANGPRGSPALAPATKIGASGRMQGLRIVSRPAAKASGIAAMRFTSPPSAR